MFLTAQFLPVSWQTQAIVWTVFSSLATGIMVRWTRFWVSVERVEWVLDFWVFLMLAGLVMTDLGIFLVWTPVLCNLCPLWLGLSALGYFANGLAVRSRAIIAISIFHLLAVLALLYVEGWQFLLTGLIMAASLLLLAQLQWDMRLPICYTLLTPQQKQFNQQQQRLRQRSS